MRLLLIWLVRGYQYFLSPMFGRQCKFYPSCSHYAIEALSAHSVWRALWYIAWRLLRCNPWSKGGVDMVPEKGRRLPN